MTTPSADDEARPADAGRAPAPDEAPLPGEAQDPDTAEGAAVEAEKAAAAAEAAALEAEHAATRAEDAFATAQTLAPETATPATSNGGQPLLRLVGIGKNFGPVRALVGVDLDVPIGQVTAIVGDNGAGKSTLIKTIAGIWQQDHGELIWQGHPVRIHSPKGATDLGIATVYQDLALCDNLDIVQNMFLGREPVKFFQLDEVSMETAAKRTLADLHVVTVRSVRQLVGSLSGGQRQAVAVAKAVLRQAKLVIMDEPTAALGVTQTRVVLDLIRRLKSQDIAVIVISHNLTDVLAVADRIAVLYLGRLVAVGPMSQFDSQSIVDLMTTGSSKRITAAAAEQS
ncbi:MAG TPA: ATP-binding cassette domain-containing protein [Streptosporangiaceae bacterium]|nr:ATP-binding cassette domain-containing protein [Streptosporangiaceae bacterium]